MKTTTAFAFLSLAICYASGAHAVTIDTVLVGNAGNGADTRYETPGYGSVDYTYNIGTYEVTAGQYRDFLNAVDPGHTNPNGVYSSAMDTQHSGCQITWNVGAHTYDFSGGAVEVPGSTEVDWANRPVNYVSWYDAARFANWLTTGGTEDGVYKFSGGVLQSIMDHQAAGTAYGTAYFIPTEDEWYKAAYYDPTDYDPDGPGGVDPGAGYWDYPTSNDTAPINTLPDPGNHANFSDGFGRPYWRTEVGDFQNSASPYGTFDQGGNVSEWNETLIGSWRGVRGGDWIRGSDYLHASDRSNNNPADNYNIIGFRVASIPEPSLLTGDFDEDDDVDGADFLFWQRGEVSNPPSQSDLALWEANFNTLVSGDFDGDGDTDGADFLYWQLNDGNEANLDLWKATFGNASGPMIAASTGVPEPSTGIILLLGMAALLTRRGVVVP